jgi:hypothetical protein
MAILWSYARNLLFYNNGMSMMKKDKWVYRKAGDRIRIEKNRKYMMQLPRDAKVTFDALKALRNDANKESASQINEEQEEKGHEKGVYEILTEHNKTDAEPTEEEIKKVLWEISK